MASMASKISRCAGRKQSSTCSEVATSSKADGLMNNPPSTDRSASRLWGGDRLGVDCEATTSNMRGRESTTGHPAGHLRTDAATALFFFFRDIAGDGGRKD